MNPDEHCPHCHGAEPDLQHPPETKSVEGGDGRASAEATLIVPDMGSNHCAGLVRTSLERVAGVGEISTNISDHRVRVTYDPRQTQPEGLRQAVERGGYEVEAVERGEVEEEDEAVQHCAGRITVHRRLAQCSRHRGICPIHPGIVPSERSGMTNWRTTPPA